MAKSKIPKKSLNRSADIFLADACPIKDDVDEDEVTCRLVEYIVETCGDLWSKCHTEEDVRRMKDMQVESLLIKNREASIDIGQCPTAKKLR